MGGAKDNVMICPDCNNPVKVWQGNNVLRCDECGFPLPHPLPYEKPTITHITSDELEQRLPVIGKLVKEIEFLRLNIDMYRDGWMYDDDSEVWYHTRTDKHLDESSVIAYRMEALSIGGDVSLTPPPF